MDSVTLTQIDKHIHELRKSRISWKKIAIDSNFTNNEALEMIVNINTKIEAYKSLSRNSWPHNEPTDEQILSRSNSWINMNDFNELY